MPQPSLHCSWRFCSRPQHVVSAEPLTVTRRSSDGSITTFEGIATVLNEHSLRVYLDEADDLALGDRVEVQVDTVRYHAELGGAVVGLVRSRKGGIPVHTIEVLDFHSSELEYLQILYDRTPSLPQELKPGFGMTDDLFRNAIYRLARNLH